MNIVKLALALNAMVFASAAFGQPESPALQLLARRLDADERRLADWANLARYREENARIEAPAPREDRVVFMGDSITDFWGRGVGEFFPDHPYINRGIGGQITPQMLLRFRADVVALKPRVVVILAGTNDLSDGSSVAAIEDNLASMADVSRANGIRIVLASVLPVNGYADSDMIQERPPWKIVELNAWIKAYAQRMGLVYLDYYSAMLDKQQWLRKELSEDGLHPNSAGYQIMTPLALHAIQQALAH